MTALSSEAVPGTRPVPAGLFRFAVFATAFTLLHIKLGATVTSTGAGMAFADWPLSNGSLWPPDMDLSGYFEHVHRVSGTLVGVFSIVLLAWIWRVDSRVWTRNIAWILLVMVTIQGVLGGLGVTMSQDGAVTWWPAAVGHGVLAQPTLCLFALLAFALSKSWNDRLEVPRSQASTARKLATVALVFVFLQIAVGAVVRHTNAQGMLWLHVFMAVFVSFAIMISTAYNSGKFAERSGSFRSMGRWVWVLLSLQIVLGLFTLLFRRPKDPSNIEYIGRSFVATGHVAIGATLFVLATLLLALAWRTLRVAPTSEVIA